MQLEIYALSAGCSLLISPGRCLGLEPKWHCHFGIPRQRTHLYYVSILMMGCLWGFAGVDILRTSTLPFSPADHHASDIGDAATSQKVYQLTAHNSYSKPDGYIPSTQDGPGGHIYYVGRRGQRSLIAVPRTSLVHFYIRI